MPKYSEQDVADHTKWTGIDPEFLPVSRAATVAGLERRDPIHASGFLQFIFFVSLLKRFKQAETSR
jgi:hypothetical protein